MKLRKVSIGQLILLAAMAFVFLGIHRDGFLSSGFEKISNGMSRKEVVDTMGILAFTLHCDVYIAPKGCAQVYEYPVSFAPLDPEYYLIYFDTDKKVVGKDELQSP